MDTSTSTIHGITMEAQRSNNITTNMSFHLIFSKQASKIHHPATDNQQQGSTKNKHRRVNNTLCYVAANGGFAQAWPKQQKLDEVERIIKFLGLTKVAASKISMVSEGEQKRVKQPLYGTFDRSVLFAFG
jgi:ABC-type molybdenum transport system ATPase subunit/photorepair protein PhrA